MKKLLTLLSFSHHMFRDKPHVLLQLRKPLMNSCHVQDLISTQWIQT